MLNEFFLKIKTFWKLCLMQSSDSQHHITHNSQLPAPLVYLRQLTSAMIYRNSPHYHQVSCQSRLPTRAVHLNLFQFRTVFCSTWTTFFPPKWPPNMSWVEGEVGRVAVDSHKTKTACSKDKLFLPRAGHVWEGLIPLAVQVWTCRK